MKIGIKKFFKSLIVIVVLTMMITNLIPASSLAAGNDSVYLQLASDQYIGSTTTVLSTTINLAASQTVFIQSDGRMWPNTGNTDCAEMRLVVDGNEVGNQCLIDWRGATLTACHHSFNCIYAVGLSAGSHTFALRAIPIAGAFLIGARANLCVMTNITCGISESILNNDSSTYNFTTYGITPPTAVPHSTFVSCSVNNTAGPVIALGSGRGYYTTNGGDMMLGFFNDSTQLPSDQGTWSVNDAYSGCERQAPMYNQAYINTLGSHTISYDASEIPWPAGMGENPVQYKVGASTTMVAFSGNQIVSGSSVQSVIKNDCNQFVQVGANNTVAIAKSIVNIPSGHNGVVMFEAKARECGSMADNASGLVLLWIDIDGTAVGSLGIQQLAANGAGSQRTLCASYLSAGANALSVGNHTVTVYAQTQGNFSSMSVSKDCPLIWFDGQSGTPAAGTNLLANPGFESGLTSWNAGNGTSIAVDTTYKKSGNNSCRVYNRAATYYMVYQDITSILNTNGKGGYNLGAWLRFASSSDYAHVEIWISDSSGNYPVYSSSSLVGTSFTQMLGTMNLQWTGTLSSAAIYVTNCSLLSDMYVDDFYLSKY